MKRGLTLLLIVCTVALSACRFDIDVQVDMEADGTGVVTVNAVADAALMEQVPDLLNDLRLDDATANGWVTEGPVAQPDGSAEITLTHEFFSADELANVLNSIGPPLTNVGIARTPGEEQTTNAIDASLQLEDGYQAFADNDLIAAVGGIPFQLDAAAPPSETMSFTLRVHLPGELQRAETGTDVGDGVIEWSAPLDGSALQVRSETVQPIAGEENTWAKPLSSVAFVLFVVWCVIALAFIAFVAIARRRKQQRRQQALRRLDRNGRR